MERRPETDRDLSPDDQVDATIERLGTAGVTREWRQLVDRLERRLSGDPDRDPAVAERLDVLDRAIERLL